MIGSTRLVTVLAYAAPVDMRKSFDGLTALVTQELGQDVLAGGVYLFISRSRKRAKVLFWDGTGLCLYAKRLEKGRFTAVWEGKSGVPVRMTTTELALFLEGSELAGRVTLSPPPFSPLSPFAEALPSTTTVL